jgi:hypothetical protein
MPKKTEQLTFRLAADLKLQLKKIADETGRTMGQVCDAFLRRGVKQYRSKGRSVIDAELRT